MQSGYSLPSTYYYYYPLLGFMPLNFILCTAIQWLRSLHLHLLAGEEMCALVLSTSQYECVCAAQYVKCIRNVIAAVNSSVCTIHA